VGEREYKMLKLSVSSFGLGSALLTEGSILDPCYENWELLRW
jgi:hypothetical protein